MQTQMINKCKSDWAQNDNPDLVFYSFFRKDDGVDSEIELHHDGHICQDEMDALLRNGSIFSENYNGIVSIFRTDKNGTVNITKDVVIRSINAAAIGLSEYSSDESVSISEIIDAWPEWLFTNISRDDFSDLVDRIISENQFECGKWFNYQQQERTFTTMGVA